MLAFPPTQIGYPQHRRVLRFLQISRHELRTVDSPTLEVITSAVAFFGLAQTQYFGCLNKEESGL